MPILLQCPQCNARMKAPDGSEGRKAKCPRCGTLIPIVAGDDSPKGGEEEVEGGEDAGLFSPTKKQSGQRMSVPGKKSSPNVKKKKDDDEEEDDDVPVKKGRKIVDEDDDDDNVTADDDEGSGAFDFKDDDEDEDDDRPRKKKRKKRRRRGRGPSDVDPALIENGWNMIKSSFGVGVFALCCCWPVSIVGAFMGLAGAGIGLNVMIKGDASTGMTQMLLGFLGFLFNVGDFIAGLAFAASGGYDDMGNN